MSRNFQHHQLAILRHPLLPYVLRAVNDVHGEFSTYTPPDEVYSGYRSENPLDSAASAPNRPAQPAAEGANAVPEDLSAPATLDTDLTAFLLKFLRLLEIERDEMHLLQKDAEDYCGKLLEQLAAYSLQSGGIPVSNPLGSASDAALVSLSNPLAVRAPFPSTISLSALARSAMSPDDRIPTVKSEAAEPNRTSTPTVKMENMTAPSPAISDTSVSARLRNTANAMSSPFGIADGVVESLTRKRSMNTPTGDDPSEKRGKRPDGGPGSVEPLPPALSSGPIASPGGYLLSPTNRTSVEQLLQSANGISSSSLSSFSTTPTPKTTDAFSVLSSDPLQRLGLPALSPTGLNSDALRRAQPINLVDLLRQQQEQQAIIQRAALVRAAAPSMDTGTLVALSSNQSAFAAFMAQQQQRSAAASQWPAYLSLPSNHPSAPSVTPTSAPSTQDSFASINESASRLLASLQSTHSAGTSQSINANSAGGPSATGNSS